MSDKEQNKTSSPKKKVAIGIIAGVLAVSVITVFAAIVVQTLAVKNYFKSADSTPPTVKETFNGTLKEDIKIQNDADYDVYVRAKLVFTLKDDYGNILGYVPVGIKEGEATGTGVAEDYEYTYKLGETTKEKSTDYMTATAGQWIYNEVDGFYYYSSPVSGKIAESKNADLRQTAILMDEIKINENSKVIKEYKAKGYSLHVEVLSQFVQVAGFVDEYENDKYDATKEVENIPPIEDAWGAEIIKNKEASNYLCINKLPAAK